MGRLDGASSSGRLKKKTQDVSTSEGLEAVAKKGGYDDKAKEILEKKPKLSILQRLGKGLGAFNPADAILTGVEKGGLRGAAEGVGRYGAGIALGVGSAITGRDFEKEILGERRTFSDVAEEVGVENKIAKFGIGVLGDIFLDPSTYFGGAIARGIGKGVSFGGNAFLKGLGKVSPDVEKGLRLTGTGAKDALSKAFVYGSGTSKGLTNQALEYMGKITKAKEGIVLSNIARLGTNVLSRSQQEELVAKLLAGKRTEFDARTFTDRVAKAGFDEDTSQKILRYQLTKEAVESNPARQLAKFANRNGELPEVLGKGTSLFGKTGDDISSQLGFNDSEEARRAYEAYRGQAKELDELRRDLMETKKAFKDKQALDEFLAPNRAVQDAAKQFGREAAQSSDPKVQQVITAQSARSQQFAKAAGISDPFEIYFPSLSKERLKKFFDAAKVLKVGSEGYRKQFRDLLTDEELVRDPAEAFARREFEMVKDKIVRSELKSAIQNFGKPLTAFKSAQEAEKAGYKLVKEKGGFGKEVGYLKEVDKKFLDNLISPEFTTIDAIARATGFDAFTSLFKRSVTGLFAPFHVRNYVSGIIQNFEVLGPAALNPMNIVAGQKAAWMMARGKKFPSKIVQLGGRTIDIGKAFRAFEKRFGTSSQYIADIGDATREASPVPGRLLGKESLKTTLKTAGLGQQSIPFRAARAVGNFVETQQKATAFITALRQGKSIEQALDLSVRSGFDYRALTPFESKVLRRLIPFYSFSRKNIELQLRTLGENPQRINQIIATLENSQGNLTEEEKEQLPDYAKEQFVLKTGETVRGVPEIAVGLGTPVEQLSTLFSENPVRRIAATLNPLFKFTLEEAFGKDFFLNRDLDEVIEAKEYSRAPQFIKDFLEIKEVERTSKDGTKKTSYNADPFKYHILRNLPTTRGATYLNAIFDPKTTDSSRLLNALTGVKPRPIDLETVEYFRQRDKRRELEDFLIAAGLLKRFEKPYEPKK